MFDNYGICISVYVGTSAEKWHFNIRELHENKSRKNELPFKERWTAEVSAINKAFRLLEKKLKAMNLHVLN